MRVCERKCACLCEEGLGGLCSLGNSAQNQRRLLLPPASLCSVTLRVAEAGRGQRFLLREAVHTAFHVDGDVQRGVQVSPLCLLHPGLEAHVLHMSARLSLQGEEVRASVWVKMP